MSATLPPLLRKTKIDQKKKRQYKKRSSFRVVGAAPARSRRIDGHLVARSVQANTADDEGQDDEEEAGGGAQALLGAGEPAALVEVEPQGAGDAVREPGGAQGADEAEQVAEVGDGLGDDPRDSPGERAQSDPRRRGDEAAAVQVLGAREHAQVHVLGRDVGEDDTGDDDL